MSVSCPNPNHPDFIRLTELLGEEEAYRQYMLNAYEIPNPDLYENVNLPEVNFSLKVTNALKSIAEVRETIRLNTKENPYIETNLRKLLQGKGVYTEQIDFIFDYMKARNITEISTEQLAAELASEYSYTVEINTSKIKQIKNPEQDLTGASSRFNLLNSLTGQSIGQTNTEINSSFYSNLTVPGGTNYTENEIATPDITPSIKGHAQFATDQGIGWFRSDDKIGDKYNVVTENGIMSQNMSLEEATEIADNLRNRFDNVKLVKYEKGDNTKTRRILEVQSDLFQKGRDRKKLSNSITEVFNDNLKSHQYRKGFEYNGSKYGNIDGGFYKTNPYTPISKLEFDNVYKKIIDEINNKNNNKNKFLQLLNEGNNWVTFFVKSIIQDSAKKGYEKVLFPTGTTASKVEGHTTLEEFKKEKESRLEKLKRELNYNLPYTDEKNYSIKIENEGKRISLKKPVGTGPRSSVEEAENEIKREVQEAKTKVESLNKEINQLNQELARVETEGLAALAPIYSFYENTVTNILKKQGYNIKKVTDEYGNTWNEVNIKPQRDLNKILLRNVEEDNDIPLTDAQLYEHANKFYGKLKVPFQIVTEEFVENHNRNNPNNQIGKFTKGFYSQELNRVYLISGRAGFYTALHEFTHPLVEWVYRNNPSLFKTLISRLKSEQGEDAFVNFLRSNNYNQFVVNGKVTDDGWKEILTTEIEKASISILNGAPIKPNSFLDAVRLFWKKLKEAISNLVSKDIGKLNEKQLMNLTIRDLAIFMLDGDVKLDLYSMSFGESLDNVTNEARGTLFFKNGSTSFQTAVAAQVAAYKERTGKNISKSQLDVLNILLPYQALQREEDGYRDVVNNIDFVRTTSYLESLPGPNEEPNYFAYHGEDDDVIGLEAAEWGNQVDELAQFIIQGLDEDSAINQVIDNHNTRTASSERLSESIVSEETLRKLYPKLKNLINNKYKDYIILPQVILADNSKKIAGTADILLISPQGKIKIIDVKTGKRSTESIEFTKSYPEGSSKKQKYTAQLSVYKALAKNMGLIFESSDDLSLIPVFFPNVSESEITEARLEPVVPISAFEYVLDGFKTGSYTPIDDTKSDDPEVVLLKQVKIILTKRLSELNKLPESFKKTQAINETNEILQTINNAEPIKKLTEFINGLHKQFTNQIKHNKAGKKYTIFGLPSQIKYLTLQLASGEISKDEALSKFLYIKKINDLYSPILDSVRNIINLKDESIAKSNAKSKLDEIQDGIVFIKKTYEKETIEIMSDIIAGSVSQKANEQAKELLKFKKERIDKETNPKKKEKLQKEYDQDLINLKSPEGITRDVIKKALLEGSSADINWLDLWFTPAVTSSSEIVSPFAMMLKDKLEDARQDLIKFERDAGQAFENFSKDSYGKDNPAEFNRGLYQEVEFFDEFDETGKPIFKKKMTFVSPIDITKFQKQRAEFQRLLNNADSKDRRALLSRYYSDNFVRKNLEDTVIINPITKERVVIEEGINTMIEKKKLLFEKGVISETEYENYVDNSKGYIENGVTKYRSEFLTINPVKFRNEAYYNLAGSKKTYYDFLVSSYFKSQSRLPHKMGYVLPSIHKSGFDAVREGGLIKYLKYEWQQLKDFKEEDVARYGEEGKTIPLIYNFDMDAQDVSLDLIQSIVMYEAESLEYSAKSKVADTGEVLLSLVENVNPYDTDSLGNKKLDAFAEKAGVKDEFLKYKKLFKGNNVASLLAYYIDSQIYGKLNVKGIGSDVKVPIFGMKVEKLVDSIMGFASMTQVGGNPIGSVSNYLQANIQAIIETAAKKHMSVESWLKSRGIYDSHILDYIGDFNSPYSKSLIGQIIDLYDPMQGEYKDAAGRRISKSMFKKMWSTNSWFFLQHQGEHSIQIRTMIAMMLDTKVLDKNGKYINLFNAYEKGSDGKIKLKEGVRLQGKLSENGLISREFQSKLHGINKELHGVYNKQDRPKIESYWYGRLIVMYKKFLAPGLKRRYKALGYNQEIGDVTEGYLKTFYKKLMIDAAEVGKFIIGIDNGYFEPHEKENLRRARREMLIVATTGLIIMLVSSLLDNADDDDDDYKLKLKFLLYTALRLNNDLGIYGSPGDPQNLLLPSPGEMYKTLKNPIAATSVTNRLSKLLNQMTHPTETYKVDSGFWEKGDNKLWVAWLKFWGFNGTNFDPSNSIKFIQMSTK